MTLRIRTLLGVGIGLAFVVLMAACGGGTRERATVEIQFYPSETPAGQVLEPTSMPAATSAPLQAQATATTAAPVATSSVQENPAGDQMDQMLQKLDDSLSKTDTLQDEP